jgi:Raf kinase inhibitor-like YbhB/YbcL family protein
MVLAAWIMAFGVMRGGETMAFELKSSAFNPGQPIPQKYSCDGPDFSVPLAWTDPPAGVKSFALIADDPDAPMGTWVHWVVYDLPSDTRGLAEGVPKQETLRDGSIQGMNDFGRIGYGGPCPPPGKPHRYFFKLYALDKKIDLGPQATKPDVLDAIKNHILTEAQLMGTYKR